MIVWLASYPRSGNTFFRVILNSVFGVKTYSIYDDKSDIGADEKTSEVVGHEFLPQNFDIEKARLEEKIYYIKTHELLDSRVDENDKVIYLIRDGRESTLSFTKHRNIYRKLNIKLIDTIYGNTFIGSWGEHVNSWSPKDRENTLFIKFEELIKEPIKFIETLSNFLEVNPIGNDIPTFEELKKINPKFFRSGKTNSWENVFTQEEHISFWLKNYKQMNEYGYDYKKPDNFDELLTNNILNLESIRQNNYIINVFLKEINKIQITSQIFNNFNQELEQKQKVIEQKNNELKVKNQELEQKQKVIEQKNNELKEKNQELEQKQKEFNKLDSSFEKQNHKYSCLMANLEKISTISVKSNPIEKYKEYKKLLFLYDELKGKQNEK